MYSESEHDLKDSQHTIDELYQNIYETNGVPFTTWGDLPILSEHTSSDIPNNSNLNSSSNFLFPNFSLFPGNPYGTNGSDPEPSFDPTVTYSLDGIPVATHCSSSTLYSSGSESINFNPRRNSSSCSPPRGALGLPAIDEALSTSHMNIKEDEDAMDLIERYFNLNPEQPIALASPSESTPPFQAVDNQPNPKLPIKRLKPRQSKRELKNREKKPKASHMVIEQKYRNSLIYGINELKSELPFAPGPQGKGLVALGEIEPPTKLNKSTVLRKATEYIQELKRNKSCLEHQNHRLREAMSSLPGGLDLLNELESELTEPSSPSDSAHSSPESFSSSSPTSRFLMAPFLFLVLWNVPSYIETRDSLSPHHSKVMSLAGFPLVTVAMFCLSLYILSGISFLQRSTPSSKNRKPSGIHSEVEQCRFSHSVSLWSNLSTFFRNLYLLVWAYLQTLNPLSNFGTPQVLLPSEVLEFTVLNYVSLPTTSNWTTNLSSFLSKCSFFLVLLRSNLVTSTQPRPDIFVSLSLLSLGLIPDFLSRRQVARYFLGEALKLTPPSLLKSPRFFEWLVLLPQRLSTSSNTAFKTDDLIIWLSNQYYLYDLDQLAKAYLSEPTSPPSLQSTISLLSKDTLSSVTRPSLILVMELEATMAFSSGYGRYATALTLKLVQQALHHPDYFSSESKWALRGLVGCMLALEGPLHNAQRASGLLQSYLVNTHPAHFQTSIEFLVSHLFLTFSLSLYERKTASPHEVHPNSPGQLTKLTRYIHDLRLNLCHLPLHPVPTTRDTTFTSKNEFRHEMAVHYQSLAKWLASNGSSLSLAFRSDVL